MRKRIHFTLIIGVVVFTCFAQDSKFDLSRPAFFDQTGQKPTEQIADDMSPDKQEFWAVDYVGADGRKYPSKEILDLMVDPSPSNAEKLIEKARLKQERLDQVMPLVNQAITELTLVKPVPSKEKQVFSNTDVVSGRKILFFFSDGCGPCQQQKKVLQRFVVTHKVPVTGIPLDDTLPNQDYGFPMEINPGLRKTFAVTTTPTLVFLSDSGKTVKVERFMSLSELESMREFK